jgi:polyphosphate kinase 2
MPDTLHPETRSFPRVTPTPSATPSRRASIPTRNASAAACTRRGRPSFRPSSSRSSSGRRTRVRSSSFSSKAATRPERAARSSAITEHLNPRHARVVALDKPSDKERGQWFFQRYIEQLPTAGEIVLYDRSWYNRAGVERVMGFCTPNDYLEFMRQTPELERMLVRSGIRLYKYWFSVTREEQRRRFIERETDPLKVWKLSPIDKASLEKWDDYTEAKEAMFFYTDTADAPWIIVKSDDKKRARLEAMKHFLSTIDYPGKDRRIATKPDPLIVGRAEHVVHRSEHILGTSLHPDHRRAARPPAAPKPAPAAAEPVAPAAKPEVT